MMLGLPTFTSLQRAGQHPGLGEPGADLEWLCALFDCVLSSGRPPLATMGTEEVPTWPTALSPSGE